MIALFSLNPDAASKGFSKHPVNQSWQLRWNLLLTLDTLGIHGFNIHHFNYSEAPLKFMIATEVDFVT